MINEDHHGTSNFCRKLLNYFTPKFTSGLTTTSDRAYRGDILKIFKNRAHKLDLESKLFVVERNNIIMDTYIRFIKDKNTVIFCASVAYAEEVAKLFKENNINCEEASGGMRNRDINRILEAYENGSINILCACDLQNEDWDSPNIEVLFMARPTMSKTIYLQQLGRGMKLAKDKEYLIVFGFIGNVNLFNISSSFHRMFNIKEYRPGEYVLSTDQKNLDKDLIGRRK